MQLHRSLNSLGKFDSIQHGARYSTGARCNVDRIRVRSQHAARECFDPQTRCITLEFPVGAQDGHSDRSSHKQLAKCVPGDLSQ